MEQRSGLALHNLMPAPGATKRRKRVGRGNASGHGNYSGRGIKGQKARSGGKVRPGFEGGQMPLSRRIPHLRGFKAFDKVEYQVVNVRDLERFEDGATVSAEELFKVGLVKKKDRPIKILGEGDLSKKLVVIANAFSKSAREKIESAGGTVQVI